MLTCLATSHIFFIAVLMNISPAYFILNVYCKYDSYLMDMLYMYLMYPCSFFFFESIIQLHHFSLSVLPSKPSYILIFALLKVMTFFFKLNSVTCICIYEYPHVLLNITCLDHIMDICFQGWPFGIGESICVLFTGEGYFSYSQHS